MNVERVRELATAIRTASLVERDVGFNMSVFNETIERADCADMTGHNCGTVACVAGWAALMWAEEELTEDDDYINFLSNTLDVSFEMAENIATPDVSDGTLDYSVITTDQAADMLERLADTGEVKWNLLQE